MMLPFQRIIFIYNVYIYFYKPGRVRLWFKDNSLKHNSFSAEKLLKIRYFRNCRYTNMKEPFSLFALFTKREGKPGAVGSQSGSKITRCLFSMSSCLLVLSFCRFVRSSCLLVVSSRSGKAESWQLSLTSSLVQLTSRSHKKFLNWQ